MMEVMIGRYFHWVKTWKLDWLSDYVSKGVTKQYLKPNQNQYYVSTGVAPGGESSPARRCLH